MTHEKVLNRWFVVAGAFIIQLCLGSIYAYGAFSKPLLADLDSSLLQNQMPFALGLFFFAITMVFAGRWQDKVGPRPVAFTGGIILGTGVILSSFATSIEMLYVTYGMIGGAGIGFAYVCPIAALVKWFPDKKGLISGIAVAGFGAGAFIFARYATMVMVADISTGEMDFLKYDLDGITFEDEPFLEEYTDLTGLEIYMLTHDHQANAPLQYNGSSVTKQMLLDSAVKDADLSESELDLLVEQNPGNLSQKDRETREEAMGTAREHMLAESKNDVYARFDWSGAFLHLGIIFLVAVVLGSFLLANPPEGWLLKGGVPLVHNPVTDEVVKENYSWQEILKTPTFWLIWGMFLLAATSGLMTIGNIGKFASDVNIGVSEIAWIVGVLSLFNGAGRIAWGFVSDRVGRTKTLFIMYLIQAATMLTLDGMGRAGAFALIIGAALVGFCFGGNFAMFPSATADFFGMKRVGRNYGFVFTSYGIAGILGAIITGKLYDATGSYALIFTIMGILSIVAALLTFITKAPHEKVRIGNFLRPSTSQ